MTYLITAIVIQVMNDIFMATSVFFTEQENHRLESQYEESLIVKLFFFQFINSYAMLFYIAFFRTMIGDDCTGGQGCMGELSLALFVIFGFRLVYINAEESLVTPSPSPPHSSPSLPNSACPSAPLPRHTCLASWVPFLVGPSPQNRCRCQLARPHRSLRRRSPFGGVPHRATRIPSPETSASSLCPRSRGASC